VSTPHSKPSSSAELVEVAIYDPAGRLVHKLWGTRQGSSWWVDLDESVTSKPGRWAMHIRHPALWKKRPPIVFPRRDRP
jgi:hypothetical protein